MLIRLKQAMTRKVWYHNKSFLKSSEPYLKGRVIDIGSGGTKYKRLILSFPKVTGYTALDFFRTDGVDIVADLNKPLPIADASYDSAICISVIEHLLEPQLALREIGRIIKSGGHLLLSTPWIYPFHGEPHDYFRFSRVALEYLLQQAGFEIVYRSSTGGRFRIVSVLLVRWLPFFKLFSFVIDWANAFFYSQRRNESAPFDNTPSNHIIARRH